MNETTKRQFNRSSERPNTQPNTESIYDVADKMAALEEKYEDDYGEMWDKLSDWIAEQMVTK